MMDETNKRPQEAPAPEAEATEQKAAPKAEKAPEKEKKETKKDLEAQLAAARTEAEKARAEAEEARDRLLRTAAEYDNFRKRSAREQDAAFGNGVAHAVSQILSILDALEMAEAAPSTDENFKKGVTLTLEKAKGAFEALKVEEIPALGLPFDPADWPEEGTSAVYFHMQYPKGWLALGTAGSAALLLWCGAVRKCKGAKGKGEIRRERKETEDPDDR